MPVKFADLSKAANDLLNKGFDGNNSVKVNTKGANGVKYNAEIKSKGNGKVAGKVGASFSHSSGFNVKKLEIANNGTLSSDVNVTGAVDNTTFTLSVCMKPLAVPPQGEKCEVGLVYAHDKAKVTLDVSPVDDTSVALSVLAKVHDNVLIGGSYSGKLDETWKHTSDNVGLGYINGGNTVTLTSSKFFNNFDLKLHHKHSDDIAFAAAVGLSRSDISSASITLGGSYKIDGDTSVRGKVNVPKGTLVGATGSVGYAQKLNANVKLTAASTIQLDPQDDLFGANFALGLEFGSC